MRRIPENEIETDFERQYAWGDDERHYYHPNRRKASVFGFHLRLNSVIELVKKHASGPRVADIASAQGNFGLLLAEAGFDVTAIDLQEDFLRYARKRHTSGKFRTVHANFLEFRDPERFDAVLMGEIIEHVAFPEQLLACASENLKPGGILVLTTPNGAEYGSPLPTYSQVTDVEALIPRQFHWGDHLFLYTEQELRNLLDRAGFDVVSLEKQNSSYVSQIKGLRYLLPLRALERFERLARRWKKGGKDSTCSIVLVARRRMNSF